MKTTKLGKYKYSMLKFGNGRPSIKDIPFFDKDNKEVETILKSDHIVLIKTTGNSCASNTYMDIYEIA